MYFASRLQYIMQRRKHYHLKHSFTVTAFKMVQFSMYQADTKVP